MEKEKLVIPSKLIKSLRKQFEKNFENAEIVDTQWVAINKWKVFLTFEGEGLSALEAIKIAYLLQKNIEDEKYEITEFKRRYNENYQDKVNRYYITFTRSENYELI